MFNADYGPVSLSATSVQVRIWTLHVPYLLHANVDTAFLRPRLDDGQSLSNAFVEGPAHDSRWFPVGSGEAGVKRDRGARPCQTELAIVDTAPTLQNANGMRSIALAASTSVLESIAWLLSIGTHDEDRRGCT